MGDASYFEPDMAQCRRRLLGKKKKGKKGGKRGKKGGKVPLRLRTVRNVNARTHMFSLTEVFG
jgi:hypothetical protein